MEPSTIKKCSTCIHADLPVISSPCSTCFPSVRLYTSWESKTPKTQTLPPLEYIAAIHATVPEESVKTLGIKFDQLKARWSLVPRKVMSQVVEVLTFGAAKYSSDNWMHVAPEKYYNALHRHIDAWRNGEKIDEESGKHHLAHALCCLLFMLWHDDNPTKKGPNASE